MNAAAVLLLHGLLGSAAGRADAAPPRIGAAGAVAGRVTAAAAPGAARALTSGADVFHKDAVTTDAKGKLQLMLLDQTVFTVGPDSNIVLDEFVYDPFTDAGKVTAQVTKGVFRFVTGKVAGKNPANMKIKIPSGTIGIRGTFGAGSVQPNGETLVALLGPGPENNGGERIGGMDIETSGDSVSLETPGTGVTVGSDGNISDPFTLTPEQTDALNAGDSDDSPEGSGQTASSSGGSPDDEGDEESASDAAGQDTALAGQSATAADDADDASDELGDDTAAAAQEAAEAAAIADGVSEWDDVRTLQSGQATYSGTGTLSLTQCGGGSCSSPSGSFDVTFNVDFAARTYGGGCGLIDCASSAVSGSASDSGTNTFISFNISIPQESFAALDGPAVVTVSDSNTSVDLSFLNEGGIPADDLRVAVDYDDGSNAASGSVDIESGAYGVDNKAPR